MLYLQKKIISDYFNLFGRESFQKISNKTNINVTRIFRIINGAEMRLSEYEKFQALVQNGNDQSQKLMSEIFLESNSNTLNQIIEDFEYKKHLNRLVHGGN